MTKEKTPPHPGEILLKRYLEPNGLTQLAFAEHLGWTYARLNEIINIKRGVTADSALSFSEALGTTAEYWMNLQTSWDLWHAKKDHKPTRPILDMRG
ncbi:HigA family addiction module antitoxin [Legionella sp. W05-934-2]|jgi:addiction module HigA family antidote|uniref:HigA family addiction module antitoxin n=1 Tax=Legionella sp. W05-934-2 TaxID=1198649 RepID=UPI003461CE04